MKGKRNMKTGKSYKYKNYGPIPQNEYSIDNAEKSIDAASDLGDDDDTAFRQRLVKRQTLHPSGKGKMGGWSRSWKANGWRAESASRYDVLADRGRYSGYVRISSRPL